MDRRHFCLISAGMLAAPWLGAQEWSPKFRYCLLKVGPDWQSRERALIKLSFEVQKRCNIPIEGGIQKADLNQVADIDSPFFIISGSKPLPLPSVAQAQKLRLALQAGGILLFDDFSPKGEQGFYQSAVAMMAKVFPNQRGPRPIPRDHAIYQSYYLLKEPRGRQNKRNYLEGWNTTQRTNVFFSHNDLLGALEADKLGTWKYSMEIGGSMRRELCFRLGINLAYYTLTLNYKKDRAFPPIIERRRRI